MFAAPIVILEEILKLTGRHVSRIKEMALSKLREAQIQAQIQGQHFYEMKEAAMHKMKEVQAQAHAHTPVVPPPMF
jgi:hypothetical protein